MATKTNRILMVDIERSCWVSSEEQGSQLPEIIQIGILEVDTSPGKVNIVQGSEVEYFVKPTHSEISGFCTELTGITQKNVKNSQMWPAVAASIIKRFGKNKAWMTWGRDDLLIKENNELYGIPSPFSDDFINFGFLWTAMSGSKKNVSMKNAMEGINMEFEGRQHGALTDAQNLAKLFCAFTSWNRDMTEPSANLQAIPKKTLDIKCQLT